MIYLDNAATTSLHPDVLLQMMPYLQHDFGNPSSVHQAGRIAKRGLDHARTALALWLHCDKTEIIFTSGGTEAIYAALFGAMCATERRHMVASGIEHHAVLHTLDFLQSLGATVTLVKPDSNGVIRVSDILEAVRPDTFCVSVMAVNNEIGTIQPITEIAKAVKEQDSRILFHSDMVQALGTMPIDLGNSKIDLACFSAHKIHGPKGVGALYIRQGTPWRAVLHGGVQERKRRAGTENVAGIVGFGSAVLRFRAHFDDRMASIRQVNTAFREEIHNLPGLRWFSPRNAVPTIVTVGFSGIRNDTLLMRLDLEGIAASAGSACTAGSLEPSHVLTACGYEGKILRGAIRFSFSEDTVHNDVIQAANTLKKIVLSLTV